MENLNMNEQLRLKKKAHTRLSKDYREGAKLALVSVLLSYFVFFSYLKINHIADWLNDPAKTDQLTTISAILGAFGKTTLAILLLELLVIIFCNLFVVGISFSFLDWYRAHDVSGIKMTVSMFIRQYLWPSLALSLLILMFTFLWGLLLIVPGFIKSLAYSQAYFIYRDHYQRTGTKPKLMACLKESEQLMAGHKLQYLSLQVSFIGWLLLTIVTAGLAGFYAYPYYFMTLAAFYQDLL